jgi:small subunit ribosomal protein S1
MKEELQDDLPDVSQAEEQQPQEAEQQPQDSTTSPPAEGDASKEGVDGDPPRKPKTPAKRPPRKRAKPAKEETVEKAEAPAAEVEEAAVAVPAPEAETPSEGEAVTVAEEQPIQESPEPESAEKAEALTPPSGAIVVEEQEYSDQEYQEMIKLYEDTFKDLEEGEVVRGKVVAVSEQEVIVDVGFKSEGAIPLAEFADRGELKVGDEVEVFLEKMEDQDGLVALSKSRADFVRVWNDIRDAYDHQTTVQAKVLRRIKGGLVADLFGVEAFLPGSQVALRQVPNLDQFIGRSLGVRIIKLNKRRRNIVVSRRVVLEEEREKKKSKTLAELEEGEVRKGVVKNITDFGAFVDLGGIDGLLHITDMSWGRISHPSEVVAIGDELEVKVLRFDRERERISLGLKQLSPHPWENIETKYPAGSRVRGKVVSLTDYGAFVELEKGVEGLVHVSEMSWTRHVKHPSKLVAVGDVVECVVLKVDQEGKKISLGMKQIEPDPWSTLDEKYPPGTKLSGKVRNLTSFGAFIEIEDGIDGLVHVSDMSWTRRVKHPSEILKKGDKVEVVVLRVDTDNRRVSLGLKQLQDDPWEDLTLRYGVGTETTGTVVRLLDKGVVVDLGNDVEGFVPISHLAVDDLDSPAQAFSEGDPLPLRVIDIDPRNRRIVLSVKAYMTGRSDAEYREYQRLHEPRELSAEELAGKIAGTVDDEGSESYPADENEEQHEEDEEEEEEDKKDAG